MKKRIWDDLIPAEERQIYEQTGFGAPAGLGDKAALLVIDVQQRSIGSRPMPIREAIKEYPMSCGEYGWAALPNIAELVACFRRQGLPIFFPHVAPKRAHDIGQFSTKVPAVLEIPEDGYSFVKGAEPAEGDICIPKTQASAFFGTCLNSYLIGLRVDTLIVTGATTSGCVRSTVVDATSYNYKVVVAQDAVYDRLPSIHAINLFDISSKYADVLETSEVIRLIAGQEEAESYGTA